MNSETVEELVLQLYGGKDISKHRREKSIPTTCRWEAARRMLFAHASKSLHGFSKFQRQIIKFGAPQKL